MKTIESWRGDILLETVHGSRLYGLDHENSDEDYYVVTEYGPAKQKVTVEADGTTADFFVIGLDSFLRKVEKGTHQAIEALNSPQARLHSDWAAYFRQIRTYSPLVEETYDRVIRHLAVESKFKRRRHAVRITYNLVDLRRYGRFNPEMTSKQKRVANYLAALEGDILLDVLASRLGRTRVRPEREDE